MKYVCFYITFILGGFYLFLSDDHILQLPSFTKASCNIEPYPLGHHLLDLPHNYPLKYGLSGVVSAVVDGKLHVCGGGEYKGVASCHALHGTSWHGTPNLDIPRLNAESSMWQGGWLVTGGLLDGNTRHTTSELYKGGGWTAGPSLDEKTLLTRKPLMGVEGHCQVTAGGRVIVAGRYYVCYSIKYIPTAQGATYQKVSLLEQPSLGMEAVGHSWVT